MNVCPKCGTLFDGRFCPHCGAEYVEKKICRKCGSVVTDRFCSVCGTEYVPYERKVCRVCGYPYTGTYCPRCGAMDSVPAAEKTREAAEVDPAVQKKYRTVTITPLILFFTLFFLLLIFYFLRYTTRTYTSGSGRYSSTYTEELMIFDAYDGASAWLIVFFFVYFVVALTLFIVGMVSGAKKAARLNRFQMYGIVGCAFMGMSFVNGIIICAAPSSDSKLSGVGAGPVLVLVFSLIFFVVALVCTVRSVCLVRRKSEYAAAEMADEERYLAKRGIAGAAAAGGQSYGYAARGVYDGAGTKTAIRVLAVLEIIFGCLYVLPIIFGAITLAQMKYRKPATGISVCNIIFGNIFGISCAIIVLVSPREIFVQTPAGLSPQGVKPTQNPYGGADTYGRASDDSPFVDFSGSDHGYYGNVGRGETEDDGAASDDKTLGGWDDKL